MSHTKGRLVYSAVHITVNGVQKRYHAVGIPGTKDVVAINGEVGSDDEEESIANARRLVACWNSCDGITTISLEDGNSTNRQPMLDMANGIAELEQERDELLKALREYSGGVPGAMAKAAYILAKYPEQP